MSGACAYKMDEKMGTNSQQDTPDTPSRSADSLPILKKHFILDKVMPKYFQSPMTSAFIPKDGSLMLQHRKICA